MCFHHAVLSVLRCTPLVSIADDSLQTGGSVTARIRLTQSGDILTKLATLLDHQSTSYASTQCYIAEVSIRKHDTMASMAIPKWKVHEVHRVYGTRQSMSRQVKLNRLSLT